jgi:hypothetical protein
VGNFAGPHNPMDVTPRMAADWEGVEFPSPHEGGPGQYSEENHQGNRHPPDEDHDIAATHPEIQ